MSVQKVVTVSNLDNVFKVDTTKKKIGLNVDNTTVTVTNGVLSANIPAAPTPDVELHDVAGNLIGYAFSSNE